MDARPRRARPDSGFQAEGSWGGACRWLLAGGGGFLDQRGVIDTRDDAQPAGAHRAVLVVDLEYVHEKADLPQTIGRLRSRRLPGVCSARYSPDQTKSKI